MATAAYACAGAAPTLSSPIRPSSIAYPTRFRAPRSGLVQCTVFWTADNTDVSAPLQNAPTPIIAGASHSRHTLWLRRSCGGIVGFLDIIRFGDQPGKFRLAAQRREYRIIAQIRCGYEHGV